MDGNKPQAATWVLCVDVDPDNPESAPVFVAALDMPLDGGLIGVTLPGNRLGKANRACRPNRMPGHRQGAHKRHIERGGDSDTPEMLTGLHIDPMADIRDGRP